LLSEDIKITTYCIPAVGHLVTGLLFKGWANKKHETKESLGVAQVNIAGLKIIIPSI
jgi:hypothetical protein